MTNRRDVKEHLAKIGAAASTEKIIYGPVKQGWRVCLQRIGVRDQDNAVTTLRIVVAGHGWEHVFSEESSLTANLVYWEDWPLYLSAGESLEIHFIGTTNLDDMEAWLTGFEEEVN